MSKDNNTTKSNEKVKRSFKMPHLLWLMLGIIMLSVALTYIIPAGSFGVAEDGSLVAEEFTYAGEQTPVSPITALLYIMDGLRGSSSIIFIIMISGATIRVFLDSKAVDDFLNWAIYKLQDRGTNILIVALYILIVYLGGFGGSDALVAIVPVGVLFARKLRLDPIVAVGVTTYAALIGFGTGPTKQVATQMLMDVPVYSGFITRFISMNIFMVIGLVYLMRYVKKVQNDPTKSIMYEDGWRPELDVEVDDQDLIKETTLSWRTALIMVLFFGQYIIIVAYNLSAADSSMLYNFMTAVYLVNAIIVGLLAGMSADQLATSYVRGLQSMAFVGFVIGLARVMSLVLADGNILHTIVHTLTLPLVNINRGFSSVAISAIIALINPIIPSASSKAAMLVPIIKPMTEALGLSPQIGVMAFQYGDGFTNLASPVLGWMIGSLATADVPYQKWLKWVIPPIIVMTILSLVILFVMTNSGYDGML